jgi:hypothetical protein
VKHLVPLHVNGAHGMASGAVHLPVALHVDGGVYTLLAHLSGAHCAPVGYFWHAPAPSHLPLVPQFATP